MISLDHLEQPEDIDAAIQEIYGRGLRQPVKCLHVAAVWRKGRERLVSMRILPKTPQSGYDLFALQVARARSDAIITTGANLRSEPRLTHQPPPAQSPWTALQQWREQILGKNRLPCSAVLTSGRELDFGHPIFHSKAPALLVTSLQAARSLKKRAPDGVAIEGLRNPCIRSAVDHLRQQLGYRTILIEAGPSTSRHLYRDPPGVDELMLSVYCHPELDEEVQGARFLSWPELRKVLPISSNGYRVQEKSGVWKFHHLSQG